MEESSRRDFLLVAATAFPAVGTTITLWPFVSQMNPDATTVSLGTTDVDLSQIALGQGITVQWRGKPVFIRHRLQNEIEAARAMRWYNLPDPYARNMALAWTERATDENRTVPGHEEWLVLIGVCTHAGCIPRGHNINDERGDYGGWKCPCHYSMYDTSGRVRSGPAPANLTVPPYRFITDNRISIG